MPTHILFVSLSNSPREVNSMEEIIVIRAADPDGSVFKAVVDALRG